MNVDSFGLLKNYYICDSCPAVLFAFTCFSSVFLFPFDKKKTFNWLCALKTIFVNSIKLTKIPFLNNFLLGSHFDIDRSEKIENVSDFKMGFPAYSWSWNEFIFFIFNWMLRAAIKETGFWCLRCFWNAINNLAIYFCCNIKTGSISTKYRICENSKERFCLQIKDFRKHFLTWIRRRTLAKPLAFLRNLIQWRWILSPTSSYLPRKFMQLPFLWHLAFLIYFLRPEIFS